LKKFRPDVPLPARANKFGRGVAERRGKSMWAARDRRKAWRRVTRRIMDDHRERMVRKRGEGGDSLAQGK